MKIRIKLKHLLLSTLLTTTILTISVLAVTEEYAYTQVWFNVPADVSFLIYLLGTPANVSSNETSPGNPTTWISFNASTTEYGVQPMTEGSTANKQDGPTKPIIQLYNVGNTNFNFTMNATVSIPCISLLCANSTCPAGDCTPVPTCQNIKNQPSWVPIVYNLVPNGYANITLYADFVDCSPMNEGGTIYYRSTYSAV